MIDFSKIFPLDWSKWLALHEDKGHSAQRHHANGEGHELKADSTALSLPANALTSLLPSSVAQKPALSKQTQPPRSKKPAESSEAELPATEQAFAESEMEWDASALLQAVGDEPHASVLYAQAQTAVVSDAPAGLTLPSQQTAVAVAQPTTSVPGWVDAVKTVDQIPFSGLLGGVAVAAAAGGSKGATSVIIAPVFQSAATSADGTKVVLTYSEALSATTATPGDFVVTVAGVARAVASVAINGKTVELTLGSAVSSGQEVKVAYTDPTADNDTNAVQGATGNDAATLAATVVTNKVPDTTPPTLAVTTDKTYLSKGQTAQITFTLSEAASDFTQADVTVSGGTLSNFAGSGTAYTATFTPTVNSTANGSVSVASSKFSDAAGNLNADGADANNSLSLSVDTLSPSIVISTDKTTLNAAQTTTVTFTLSDASTDFTLNDVTVSGGTLSNFSGSGVNYSAIFTPATGSTTAATISVANGAFTNSATGRANADGADANNSVSLTVDTVPPTITVSTDTNALTTGQTARITFTLSEAVSDFSQADVAVSGGYLNNFSGSGTTYTATFTPTIHSTSAGSVSVASGKFSDTAGNQNVDGADDNNTVVLLIDTTGADTTPPAVPVLSANSAIINTTSHTIEGTAEVNSTLSIFDGATLLGTAVANGSGTFSFNATGLSQAVHSITAKATDAAGNVSAASNAITVTVDTTAPAASVTASTLAATDNAVVQSSEVGTAYLVKDTVLVSNLASITGAADNTWNSVEIGIANTSINLAAIGLLDGSYHVYSADAAGNLSAMSSTAVTIDATAPVFQSAATSADGTKVVLTFSEALNNSTATSSAFVVTVAGVVQTVNSVAVNGKTAELTLSSAVTNGQAVTVAYTDPTAGNDTLALQDLVGNDAVTLTATNVTNNVPDTTPPTMVVSADKTFISKGQTALLTFTVSEVVTDFTQSDVTVSGGTLSNFTGSGKIYSATFTPTANSTFAGSVSVASGSFSDAAGNANADGADADNSVSLNIDTVSPSIAISSDKPILHAAQTAALTFTLSDASTDFTHADVVVTGGSLSNFSGSGTSYSATFTPTANSTAAGSVSVATGAFTNAATGQSNTDGADANNNVSLTVDTVPPTIAVSTDKSTLSKGQIAQITFTLSEAASDFNLADVSVSGGTLSNFAGSGENYTATFTPVASSSATGTVSVASNKFSDAAGNLNADGADANNLVSLVIDTVSPVMPVAQLDGSWTVNPQVTMAIDLGNGNRQNLVVEVYPEAAPGTVTNWLAYVNSAYYSNLIFHRVISGFMVQAGAFTSDLMQHAATYSAIPLETTQTTGLSNLMGTIAMARTNVADSATSQFFINVADNTFLDYSSSTSPGYAVFGKVLSGMSTVNSISTVSTGTVYGMADVPNNPITLTSVSQTGAGTSYSSTGKIALSGLEQGAAYSYSLDGSSVWTSLPASQTQIDLGSTLSAGLHTVAVKQTDSAGNVSAAATVQFTKYVPDYAHSVLDLLTDTTGGANDGTATDNITHSTSLSLTAALSNAFAGKTVWLMDQGVRVGSAQADAGGGLVWQSVGAALGDHVYTLYDPVNHVRIADTNIATSELLVRVV